MAPNADCEAATLDDSAPRPGRRILPQDAFPTRAWTETEDPNSSPGENRRLLPIPHKPKTRVQAGLTLGVHTLYPSPKKITLKSKFQKRKEKLFAVFKPPYFMISVIVIIVCVHLVGSSKLQAKLEWSPATWWKEPWRLFTYGFVHATSSHLALNALVALAVGWPLEREQGWWRVVALWLGGVAGGALGAGALQPRVRVVGASAAVYALLTAHLPNVCLRMGHIPLWWFRPLSVLVLGASEGCWALAGSPIASAHPYPTHDHVAWAAHALGASVGVPLAFVVFTGENEGKRYIQLLRVASGLLLAGGATSAAVYYGLWHEVEPA